MAVTLFSINDGATSTTSRTVPLNNQATGNPTQYMASETPSFEGANWNIYSTAPSFTLSSDNGTKKIYFKVKNESGASSTVSDTIILDEIIPLTINASPITGNIWPAGDMDWYKFTVTNPGTYKIETWEGSLVDNYMYLYGPGNRTTLIAKDDDSGQGFAAMITQSRIMRRLSQAVAPYAFFPFSRFLLWLKSEYSRDSLLG
jgi:hypothetical protein